MLSVRLHPASIAARDKMRRIGTLTMTMVTA